MKLAAKALILSASVFAAAPASAATLVYSFSQSSYPPSPFGPPPTSSNVLQLFDPTLGSLTAATFEVTFNISANTTRSNANSLSALNGMASGLGSFGLTNSGVLLTDVALRGNSYVSPGSAGGVCQAGGTGRSVVTGSGLTKLIGSGTTTTQGGSMLAQCEFASAPFNIAGSGYSGTVTYDYVAALVPSVPEPATWAMMLIGFGLVGGAVRRRAVVAFA